jgi:hypothetical protein
VQVLVGIEGRSGSLDGVPDFVHVTLLVPGDHQLLLLQLLLLTLHVSVCVGHVDLLRLLVSLLLRHCRVQLHHWGLDLVTGVRSKGMRVLVNLEGRSGLLDSTSNVSVGGHLVVGVFWRVVYNLQVLKVKNLSTNLQEFL